MPDSPRRVAPFLAGLMGRCPRCGEGRLFGGFLTLAPSCDRCGLDYGFADSGDGPAVFVIFAASIIVMILAMSVDALFHPAPLVHLALWIPTIIVLSLILLRPFKGAMIALQYRHDAHEGRIDRD
jgi:uncharacterized protein (DUF983 family)